MLLHESTKEKVEAEKAVEDKEREGEKGGVAYAERKLDDSLAPGHEVTKTDVLGCQRVDLPDQGGEASHLYYTSDTHTYVAWKRPEVYDVTREQHGVGTELDHLQSRPENESHHYQYEMTRHEQVVTPEISSHHDQPVMQQPPQPQQPTQQQPSSQPPQPHYHQHPKYRFLRQEGAYSPSTLSAYSETNADLRQGDSTVSAPETAIPSDRYATPPPPHPSHARPLPPPAHHTLRVEADSSTTNFAMKAEEITSGVVASQPPLPPSSPQPTPFALTKLRGVSLSHALPLPAPSAHPALPLPAHPIHGIPGYAHPFNYSLCSSFFPPFPTPEETGNPGAGVGGGVIYQSFVAKTHTSL